jgi:hypothetical protein
MRGRPFKKGESGNPGGRPKVIGELQALAREHAPDAIKELARLATKAKGETARVAAIRELLDRGYGKAAQLLDTQDEADERTCEEILASIQTYMVELFPDYRFVPVESPNSVVGPRGRSQRLVAGALPPGVLPPLALPQPPTVPKTNRRRSVI